MENESDNIDLKIERINLETKIGKVEKVSIKIDEVSEDLKKLIKEYRDESLGSAYEHLSKAKERLRYVCDKTIEEIEKKKTK